MINIVIEEVSVRLILIEYKKQCGILESGVRRGFKGYLF